LKNLISLLILVAQRFTAAITGLFSAPVSKAAENNGFVSGYRFSDTVSARNQTPV
jgi:hypothetical protein